jgi:hypothetical protein
MDETRSHGDDEDLQWWPNHVQAVFAAIGRAMVRGQLYPGTLAALPTAFGTILPDYQVSITHRSGRELGRRKGDYVLLITGPIFEGQWHFAPGKLERLAKLAAISQN